MTGSINARTYGYRAVTTTKTTGQIATLTYPDLETPLTYTYTYDSMGNIQTISDPLQGTRTYTYDTQNQLVQEKIGSTTYSYSYDNAGNLLTATNSTGSHTYTYGDSAWGDLLTKYDGQSITYDTIGNPTSYYNGTRWTLTWKNGRQLATATNGTNSISYTYDANGLRHSKTVDGVVYTYYYEGSRLMRMTVGTSITMDFFYDQNGQPFAMKYNSTMLYYVLNAQGDVVRLVNASGGSYGVYKYDAWGNILYTTDNQYLNNNPLRYRGYVYDPESSLYYCQSRYYDPATGRFINADALVSTGQGILGNNMFAYCGNNPVNLLDSSGMASVTAFSDDWNIFSDPTDDAIAGGGGIGLGILYLSVTDEQAKPNVIALKGDSLNRRYTVYFLYAKHGSPSEIVYVGRVKSENLDARINYHRTQGRELSWYVSNLTWAECRGMEQVGMIYFHTINRDNSINNQIRGVSPRNNSRNLYFNAAKAFWELNGSNYNGFMPFSYWANWTENEFLNGCMP